MILARGTKMSAGGICLFALANLAVGAQIDVEFMDSDRGTPARVSGIVRNRLVYLYGVEFLIDPQESPTNRSTRPQLGKTIISSYPSPERSSDVKLHPSRTW